MLEETYLKQYDGNNCMFSVCGPLDEICKVRDYIAHMGNNTNEDVANNETTDVIRHPGHYNRDGSLETIWEMIALYGIEATKNFCKLNAHKYRARANLKGGEEDMKKSDYYIEWYTYLIVTPEFEVMKELQKKYDRFENL